MLTEHQALEPQISEQIMTLHHQKHHQVHTYIPNPVPLTQHKLTYPGLRQRPQRGSSLPRPSPHRQRRASPNLPAASNVSTSTLPTTPLTPPSKFHGGGHINHSLFWPSLCPATSPQADPASAPRLTEALSKRFGSIDRFKSELKAVLLGVQGSGWGWLVKDQEGGLELATTKDQDPVATLAGKKEAVVGVDMVCAPLACRLGMYG